MPWVGLCVCLWSGGSLARRRGVDLGVLMPWVGLCVCLWSGGSLARRLWVDLSVLMAQCHKAMG